MIYRMEIDTPSYLCDKNDRLHAWAAVRLCQEVTEYHGNATGIGFKTLLAQNRAWVITRSYYNIIRLPMAFERIILSTWSRGNNGLIAYRDYKIETPTGELLLVGTSCWPMIDMTTRRVLRLNELIDGFEYHPECATQYETLGKIKLPNLSESDLVAQRDVVYTMLDHTQHMNNSEYIRLMSDYIDLSTIDGQRGLELDLAFHHESVLGDTLIFFTHTNDAIWCKIENSHGISISAKVSYTVL